MTLGVRGNVVAAGGQGEGESLADMMLEFSPANPNNNLNNAHGLMGNVNTSSAPHNPNNINVTNLNEYGLMRPNEQPASEANSNNGTPFKSEIEEYARFLGMNLEDSIDKNLLWIAKSGLLEPVPAPWQALKDSNDNIIYYNTETKEHSH